MHHEQFYSSFYEIASVLISYLRSETFQHNTYLLLSYLPLQHMKVKCLL